MDASTNKGRMRDSEYVKAKLSDGNNGCVVCGGPFVLYIPPDGTAASQMDAYSLSGCSVIDYSHTSDGGGSSRCDGKRPPIPSWLAYMEETNRMIRETEEAWEKMRSEKR